MPIRVLAVDDDDRMRRLLKVNLETEDIEVHEVCSGEECLRLVQEEAADLVLLDVNLPDGNGWEVLASIRSLVGMHNFPVIMLSAAPPDRNLLRQFKPTDYWQKPFDARYLTGRVRRILKKKS